MPVPITKLSKFSEPDATATDWEETRRALEGAELFWVSTVRADGRPHVTPVVAVWAEGAIWFSTGATEQKAVNIRANPNVVVTTGCNEWDHGLDVVVEGVAGRVTDDVVLRRIAAVFATKWDGRWRWAVRDGAFDSSDGDGQAIAICVRPSKIFAHSKGEPFGETRHTF